MINFTKEEVAYALLLASKCDHIYLYNDTSDNLTIGTIFNLNDEIIVIGVDEDGGKQCIVKRKNGDIIIDEQSDFNALWAAADAHRRSNLMTRIIKNRQHIKIL